MNPYARLASGSAALGALFLAFGLAGIGSLSWFSAHGTVLVLGTILPALAGWHTASLARFTQAPDGAMVQRQILAFGVATALVGGGVLFQAEAWHTIPVLLGFLALLAGSVFSLLIHLRSKPTESLVDVAKDPLTKGDDVSFKHLKFAHFFLPLGVLLLMLAFVPGIEGTRWAGRFWASGIHVALIGYGLLSLYGIGHLWVPRFSGVPAIAAGAIKGELHSTLPSMIFLPLGFMTGLSGFVIAGGAFAFLGFFTYMGVLGANIMRNKSVTHRVTPEFVYVPWTFAGIFWLVSGVLMGIFLTVVPDVLADRAGSLRSVHIHINLLGGFLQLVLAWMTRFIPGTQSPPAFRGAMKGAFYGFNAATAVAVGNMLGNGTTLGYWIALAFAVASAAAYIRAMGGFLAPAPQSSK